MAAMEALLSLIYTSFAGVGESNSLVLALLIRWMFLITSSPGAACLPNVLSSDRKIRENFRTGSLQVV